MFYSMAFGTASPVGDLDLVVGPYIFPPFVKESWGGFKSPPTTPYERGGVIYFIPILFF